MLRYLMTGGAVALTLAPAAGVDGPTAEFSVADGFLCVRVVRLGAAPGPVRVRAVTPSGHVWADGATDDDGRCEFPCPRADRCRIEIDLGGAETPPIELTFLDGGTAVVPLVAPLAPGPCCSSRASPAAAPADREVDCTPLLIPASAMVLFLGTIAWAATRPAGRPVRRRS